MNDEEYKQATGGNIMFSVLDETARRKVMDLAKIVSFSKGDTIIQQGAEDEDIYLVQKGRVDVQTMQEGFIIELNTLGPGTLFGEVAEVSSVRRTATVVAHDDVELLRFDGPSLVAELRKHPTASKLLDHIVLRRAKDTIEKTFGY